MIFRETIDLETNSQFQVIDLTPQMEKILSKSKVKFGLVSVFSPHTTAGICVNHNEPLLLQDFMKMLYRLVPIDGNYAHDFFELRRKVSPDERSNGHAHLKTMLLGGSEAIPVDQGKMLLGERQSVFFVEFDGARQRRVIISIQGE